MANRQNTLLIKRSGVVGKIPTDLAIGELALNYADVKLYASGTTANSIIPIGWDRIARTGDTMTGPLSGTSFIISGGTSTDFLKGDGSLDPTLYEPSANKQNTMVYDGTGGKFPTVDGVNLQANNLLIPTANTGFIDRLDPFKMVLTDSTTITVTGSNPGALVRTRLFTSPFVPLDAIRNISGRTFSSSSVSLPSDGRFYRYLGYDYATDSIINSTTSFVTSDNIVALGFVEIFRSGSTKIFTSFQMQVDISTVTFFDNVMISPISTANIFPNTNLTVNNNFGGVLKANAINWGQLNPHVRNIDAVDPIPFIRINPSYLTTPTGFVTGTTVDTTTYWNGSALVSTGNNNSASIQRWLMCLDGRIFLQAAEQTFVKFGDAVAAVQKVQFTDIIPSELVIELCRMVSVKPTTNLADIAQTQFFYGTGAGSTGGGTASFSTIGGSPYDNLLLGAELNSKFNVTGGTISGNTNVLGGLTANTISATTYFNLPLDIKVTGGTYSSGTTTFTNNTGGTFSVTGLPNTQTTININGVGQNISTNREWRTAQGDTGVLLFSGMTTASTSTINIGAVKGYIVDNETNPLVPTYTYVDYSGQTGVVVATRLTGTESFAFLTSGGTISFQNTFPTSSERKSKIWLGKISHPNNNITVVINEPDYITSPLALTRDFYQKISYINEGVYPYPNGANLNLNISGGKIGGNGINFVNDKTNPNELSMGPGIAQGFTYRTQTGGTTTSVTLIDPTRYDVGGVITLIPGGGGTSTIQYIFAIPGQGYIIQYGQNIYNNLANAISAVNTDQFFVFPNLVKNAILIGVIALTKNATQLNVDTQARFFKADMFGQIIGATAGVTTGTLQTAYNNSLVPQMIVNNTLGALTIQNGRTGDTQTVQEWKNLTGGTTASIAGNGKITSSTSVQVGDDLTVASASNVGSIRYRTSGNNSYADMSMQTSATGYTWVNIVQNNW